MNLYDLLALVTAAMVSGTGMVVLMYIDSKGRCRRKKAKCPSCGKTLVHP